MTGEPLPNRLEPVAVAMTMEQCWHRVPGGTAVAMLRLLDELVARPREVTVAGVSAWHREPPPARFRPPVRVRRFPMPAPVLYDSWARNGHPRPESLVRNADLVHATTMLVPHSRLPLVVTVHDLANLRDPNRFTSRGNRLFRAGLTRIQAEADAVLCSSQATMDDCLAAGLSADRLHHVPLGVSVAEPDHGAVQSWRAAHHVSDRYVLFVGTLEPRKNLARLLAAFAEVAAHDGDLHFVVAGPVGWGEQLTVPDHLSARVHLAGDVTDTMLAGLYAGASVFCYPSLQEGFGLPVLEAMALDTPVVTSNVSSTAEIAGDAAVLVDPLDISDIARGLHDALSDRTALATERRAQVARFPWSRTADLTIEQYRLVAP
jgi:glycosyltransferase involved in cell wall biosynthesis